MVPVVQKGEPVLRTPANPVDLSQIHAPALKKAIADMREILENVEDGVAIAAPQIGVPLRIFIVSKKIFDEDEKAKDIICINPEFLRLSRKKQAMEEGCLSVRFWYGHVERSEKATIRAYDEAGKLFERGGSGLLAQIFQHEMDHLDGILFTDKTDDLFELPPEKARKHIEHSKESSP